MAGNKRASESTIEAGSAGGTTPLEDRDRRRAFSQRTGIARTEQADCHISTSDNIYGVCDHGALDHYYSY